MSASGFVAPLFQWIVFAVSAVLSLLGALMMVTRRNPIHSALWLIVTFFSLAALYVMLNAHFIAVAQVIVYAGAIMMLIIFVIMLIHLETEFVQKRKLSGPKTIGAFITVILFLEILGAVLSLGGKQASAGASGASFSGSVTEVGNFLYGKYLFPFEIASILLLIGIVGAVALARRGKE